MKKFLAYAAPVLAGGLLVISMGMAQPVSVAIQDGEAKQGDTKQESTKQESSEQKDEKSETPIEDQFVPVDNMHHFMEYVCEPSYKALKVIMATEPADRKAWKAFKNHALVLAETSALVAARAPEDADKAKQWKEISLGVYKSGSALYKSAGKYKEAQKHYSAMIDQCNNVIPFSLKENISSKNPSGRPATKALRE